MSGADYDNVRRRVNELRPLIITEKEKFCLTVQAYIPAMSEYDRKYQHKQEIEEFNNRVYEQILDKETIILASKLFELISDNVELEFGASAGRFEDRLRKQIKSLTVKANLLIFIRLTLLVIIITGAATILFILNSTELPK